MRPATLDPAAWPKVQSAFSSIRGMKSASGRAPFDRPDMPIDDAAPAYHSSALKITRLIRFLSVCSLEAVFLALTGFEGFFLDIAHPLIPANPGITPPSHDADRAA